MSSIAHSFRTSPYPKPIRGRSHSDGMALSRTQRSSCLLNSAFDAPTRPAESSVASAVSDSAPSMGYPAPDISFPWHPTFPNHEAFNTDSLDHASWPYFPTENLSSNIPTTAANKIATEVSNQTPSTPPNLFASLALRPTSPPPSPSNRPQDLRFPGDLYTPTFIRKHGPKREGWCGLCQPGRWLVLKNSAFWYDKSFT